MQERRVIATTHVDAHNERITRGALEGMANDVNNGSRPMLLIEHDHTLPPQGKMIGAEVELRSDGEYQLVSIEETFVKVEEITLPDGMKLFKEEALSDRMPFANRYDILQDGYALGFDYHNFQSSAAIKRFVQEIRKETEIEFSVAPFGRKTAIPDPEIIVKIAEALVTLFVTKKVVDKAGDKIADIAIDEATKFYNFTKNVIARTVKYVRPKNRPTTYIFVAPGSPVIEFIVKSNDANTVTRAVDVTYLAKQVERALELHSTFDADKVQFLLDEAGEWKFNFLLTKSGAVIGTPASFSRRAKRIELLNLQRTSGPPRPRARKKKK